MLHALLTLFAGIWRSDRVAPPLDVASAAQPDGSRPERPIADMPIWPPEWPPEEIRMSGRFEPEHSYMTPMDDGTWSN